METQRRNCAICGKRTNDFNYGVDCCNACKSFYRRAKTSTKFPTECSSPGHCPGCRFCRFQRCLEAGIRHEVLALPRQTAPTVFTTIDFLNNLDNHRKQQFLNFIPIGNLNMNQIIESNTVALIRKPDNHQSSTHEWIMTNHITNINFLKSFQFFNQLSNSEQSQFVTQSHIPLSMLCTAMRSYSNRRQINEYPGGFDIFSNELKDFYRRCPEVLNKCRGQVLKKLWEVTITNEEFLLLCAIIVCNGVSPKFSQDARTYINKHQQEYTSYFTKYCQSTYQQNWPARFSEILNVCHTIGKAFGDLKKVIVPFQLSQPKFEDAKVLGDSLKSVMK